MLSTYRFARFSAIALLVIVAAMLCFPVIAVAATSSATSAATVPKTPVSNAVQAVNGLIAVVGMIAGLVGMFAHGKAKTVVDQISTKAAQVQTQLGSIPPEIVTACDQFFNGPDGREMGATQGLQYLVLKNPTWGLTATQVAALVDYFAPILAKIKA